MPTTTRPEYSSSQLVTQHRLQFLTAITPTNFIGRFLSGLSSPYDGMLLPTGPVVNFDFGRMLDPLTGREEILGSLRDSGSGNARIGLLKTATTRVGIVMFLVGAGVVLRFGTVSYTSDLMLEAEIWGTAGYLAAKGLEKLGMRVWDKKYPPQDERVEINPQLHPLQQAGKYVLRWFNDVSLAETVLKFTGVSDPRIQMAIFIGGDIALQLAERYAFDIPVNPREQRATIEEVAPLLEEGADETEENEENEVQAINTAVETSAPIELLRNSVEPAKRAVSSWNRFKTAAILVMMGAGAYGTQALTCTLADLSGSDLCETNTVPNRVIRFTAGFVVGAVVSKAANKVADFVTKKFGLFSKPKPLQHDEEKGLLQDSPTTPPPSPRNKHS